jgi:AcrR family transcriptional regulator
VAATTRRAYAPRLPPEERREQLLDAALEVIAEEGYGGVSIEAVARGAGVSRPVVYDSFGNLGELLRALLEREEQRAFAALAELMPVPPPADADPEEMVVEGVAAFVQAVSENPRPWRLILLPVEGTPEAVREHVDRGRRTIGGWLEQLVAWGIERRELEGFDVELAARALQALGEQMARDVLTEPERFTPERIERFARTLLSRLLS